MAKKKFNLDDSLPDANVLKEEEVSDPEVNVSENNGEIRDEAKIKIPKKEKRELKWERKTYYLTTELIEGIDEFSEESGYNKSAIVRMALREFFHRVEIQE